MRRIYRLGLLLAMMAAALLLAGFRGGQGVWFLAWLLAGVAVTSFGMLLFNMMTVTVLRAIPVGQVLAYGDSLQVELQIRHLSLLPVLWLSVSDRFVRQADGELYTVTKLVFPGFRRRFTVRYRLSGLERGEYRFTGTELVAGDWWGLAAKRRLVAASGGFAVLPDAKTVLASLLPLGGGEEKAGGGLRHGPASMGHTVREYAAGDPLHRIHWKSSARQGELMTRIMEPAEDFRFIVCLDGSIGSYKGEDGLRLFEQGVGWTAGMIQAAAENGAMAGLACSNHEELWHEPRSNPNGAGMLRSLAGVSPDGRLSLENLLNGRVMNRISAAHAVVVITPVLEKEVLEALCKLREHGRQVLVYQLLGNRPPTGRESDLKKRLELAGCRVIHVREPYHERAVRVHARYETA